MDFGKFWGGGGAASYEIEQSVRFNRNDNPYIERDIATTGSRRKATYSWWFKRGNLGNTADVMFSSKAASAGDNATKFYFEPSYRDKFTFNIGATDNTNYTFRVSDRLFRDPSAWYHAVVAINTELSSGQVKLWINGELEGTYSSIPQNKDLRLSESDKFHVIGEDPRDNQHFEGYMAEWISLDGTAVTDPNDFGEFDENGVWRSIEPSGLSFGTNGFYLKFDPSATNGIGHDHSGNGNNFTPSGFTTSGTGTDVMSDTPTKNFCTLNPLYYTASGIVQSEGNLRVVFPSAPPNGMRGGTLATTNAFYFEAEATSASSNQVFVGVQPPDWANNTTTYPGKGPDGWGYQASGSIVNNNSVVTTVSSWTANDIIGVACHPSSGTIQFFKNGTSVYSGTSVANVPMTIGVAQVGGSGNSGAFVVNCGQRAFEYTPPTGFGTLNTSNIPAPDIADGSDYFQTVQWTGDNTDDRSITVADNSDNSWQPDWVWYKRKNTTASHLLFDAVRGATIALSSNNTNTENTESNALQAFESTGFQVGSDANSNSSSYNYVAWNWKAGNGTSTNTDGNTQSTVSVNTTAGFSIVGWNSPSSGSTTVGHNLGVAPALVIAKLRNVNTHWRIWHQGLSGGNYTLFFTSAGQQVQNDAFGSAPTSTVLNIGSDFSGSGRTNIAYCFAEVEGFSKFGSYSSNNSADGPFVFCGFKPEFVWLKKTSASSNWFMYDAARNEYNVTGNKLYADSNAAENGEDGGSTTSNTIDILSNGFKLRSNNGTNNGGSYIFCAWAQHPFGGDGVSPATAR